MKTKLKDKLEKILEIHNKMNNSYFATAPESAVERRMYEEDNSLTTEFEFKGDVYRIVQITSCAIKNVNYSIRYYINDIRVSKNISCIRNILKELEGEK